MQPPVFALTAVGKHFGYRTALDAVSLEVTEGEFVLLLGGNGAGKTTLLKILSTLMRPSAGTVLFRGEPFPGAAPLARRDLAMISHESRLYADLTALENLRLFGTLYGLYGLHGLMAPAREALAEVRLADVADIPVRSFSSGMLKRLAIARLLLQRPRVLLLDEPYAGLDQGSVALLDDYLSRFTRQGGTTIMVTHQFTGGVRLCTRIVILHQGRLVYNRPACDPTAERCAELLGRYGPAGTAAATS